MTKFASILARELATFNLREYHPPGKQTPLSETKREEPLVKICLGDTKRDF